MGWSESGAPARKLGLALILGLLVSVFPRPSLAAKADTEAKKLVREAMDEDYLATNMSAAVAKLQNALRLCEPDKCAKDTLVLIHGSLGSVYAAGLSAHEDAVASFKRMLEINPNAKPDAAYLTNEVQKDFERAQKAVGASGKEPKSKSGGEPVAVLIEKPWTEQATYHPIPVYVEAPAGVQVSRVVARYRTPGAKDWKEVTLNKVSGGYGGYIPCAAVEKKGVLVYFVTAFDVNLDRVASAGSAEDPRNVKLKSAVSGRQPALPGGVPPEECPRPEQGLSCETNDDCPGAKACVNLMCVDEDSLKKPEAEDKTPRKMNWVSLAFSPDLTIVGSEDDACSANAQQDGTLSCFYSDKTQYDGQPALGNGNTLQGGVGVGSMRVLAGYDRLIGKRLTIGARLGFAFFGTPKRTDGKTFTPLHAEARGAYFFGADPFAAKGVRPYVFGGGGYGPTSARLSTEVIDSVVGTTKLDVYRTSGPFFGGAGLGVQYAVSPEAAMVIELAGRALFPDFAPVIAPSLGFTLGF